MSIVMPTYNHEKYVGIALESVLAQTYPHWELIAVDDGSTDRTVEILRACGDPRVRVVEFCHRGIQALGESYNHALDLAGGELIAILEGDDFWPADKLERQVPSFADPDVVLTWGIGVIVDSEGKILGKARPPGFDCVGGGSAMRRLLLRNYLTPSVTVMVRAEALRRTGFVQPAGAPFVDYPTWFEMVKFGKFRFVDTILGFWRVHPAQTTKRLFSMWAGEIATYAMLRRDGRVGLVLFPCLVSLATAKLIRREVMAYLPGRGKNLWRR